MKLPLRTRHPASRATLLVSAFAAHSLTWGAPDPHVWPETWSTTVAPVTAAAVAVERDEAGVAEIRDVTAATADAKPEAPCPEFDGETPALDKFRHGVERSVCVTA